MCVFIYRCKYCVVYHNVIPVGGEGLQVTDVADVRVTEKSSWDRVEVARQYHPPLQTQHLP